MIKNKTANRDAEISHVIDARLRPRHSAVFVNLRRKPSGGLHETSFSHDALVDKCNFLCQCVLNNYFTCI